MSYSKDWDNHANQLNPNNDAYYSSRGMSERPSDWSSNDYGSSKNSPTQSDWDNHSNQLNPNHPEYYHSREAGAAGTAGAQTVSDQGSSCCII